MNTTIKLYLEEFTPNNTKFSKNLVAELQKQIGFELPSVYINLMNDFNGGEGAIGENSWLCLFPMEDLIEINNDYALLMQQIPDYFLFGKDAADTGYAFHKIKQTVHSFGLMSNFKTDSIDFCGNSFLDFIEYMYNI